jgi:hypothetical protein
LPSALVIQDGYGQSSSLSMFIHPCTNDSDHFPIEMVIFRRHASRNCGQKKPIFGRFYSGPVQIHGKSIAVLSISVLNFKVVLDDFLIYVPLKW